MTEMCIGKVGRRWESRRQEGAKQGWRMLQNPTSVAATVFKEKYFKNSNLLEANLVVRPSLICSSVWEALKLLKGGLRWRVGNG